MQRLDECILFDLPKDIFIHAMLAAGVANNQITKIAGGLSSSSSQWHGFFKNDLAKRKEEAIKELLQAVIDGQRKKLITILNILPGLLLELPPKDFVIESQCTWLKFYAKKAFTMASKRKQINMVKLMIPYFDVLEKKGFISDAKTEILAQWAVDGINTPLEYPSEYGVFILWLINVFANEHFPNGVNGELSKETEDALDLFFKIIFPEEAIHLEDYIDFEQLLYAAYKVCDMERHSFVYRGFENREQFYAFAVHVIAFLQSLATPETAYIISKGLYWYYCGDFNLNISAKSVNADLKLSDGKSFYRSSRESRSGLGFDSICSTNWRYGRSLCTWPLVNGDKGLSKLLEERSEEFCEIMQRCIKGQVKK